MTDKQRLAILNKAIAELKLTKEGYVSHPNGPRWRAAMTGLNALKVDLKPVVSKVPALGPVLRGYQSVLKYDCTHYTDGIGWPAFDQGGSPGSDVIAPESLIIYDNTSGAQGGDAFYARGASGMLYWFGHITTVPVQGAKFVKGAKLTEISAQHPHPHVHLAINAVPLIGHHLISRSDYSHGAPLIGVQLARALNT